MYGFQSTDFLMTVIYQALFPQLALWQAQQKISALALI
jgi:hypothetical protein